MDVNLQIQKPLRELVYLELKHKILTGEIKARTRLMEIDLAERMNVSRTPIREAIRELATDGLVVIEPRRGAYVSDISVQNMLDIFEVREDLEGLAAGLAAQRITEEEQLALSKMHRLYEMAVEARDKEEIVEYDEKFHNFIVRCSRNNVLIELSRQVQDLSMRFRYLYYDDGNVFERIPKEHKHIMEAIVAGDAEKARREAEAHIKDLKQFIVGLDKVTR